MSVSSAAARVGAEIMKMRVEIPAVVTPFRQDGELDLAGLAAMLEWLHAEGMHGLVVAGTTGEWTSLSPS